MKRRIRRYADDREDGGLQAVGFFDPRTFSRSGPPDYRDEVVEVPRWWPSKEPSPEARERFDADRHVDLCVDERGDAAVQALQARRQALSEELENHGGLMDAGEILARQCEMAKAWNDGVAFSETLPRLCEECGDWIGCQRPSTRRHGRCSTRARNRGRQKLGNGRSAAEHARTRGERRLKRPVKMCKLCKVGYCATREALLQVDDVMNPHHLSDGLAPEVAESIVERGGRTAKRATSDQSRGPGYSVRGENA